MADDDDNVLVFRNELGQPIAVPQTVVLENDRTYQAWQSRLQGKTWKIIALEGGYVDQTAAKADVERYAREAQALLGDYSRREMLAVEVARLDTLLSVVWPMALKGHLPSIKEARDNIRDRVNVLGLDQGAGDEDPNKPTTMVIDGASYAADLQRVIDQNG